MKTLALLAALAFAALGLAPAEPRTVSLDYHVPTISQDVRQQNDCAQFAVAAVVENAGHEMNDEIFQQLLMAKTKTGRTGINLTVGLLWKWTFALRRLNGTTEDLVEELDAGRPAILVTRVTPELKASNSHAVVLTGYRTDESGRVVEWELLDARGVTKVSAELFGEIWRGQWIELSKMGK